MRIRSLSKEQRRSTRPKRVKQFIMYETKFWKNPIKNPLKLSVWTRFRMHKILRGDNEMLLLKNSYSESDNCLVGLFNTHSTHLDMLFFTLCDVVSPLYIMYTVHRPIPEYSKRLLSLTLKIRMRNSARDFVHWTMNIFTSIEIKANKKCNRILKSAETFACTENCFVFTQSYKHW